jgi:hypothetical protein
MSIPSFSLRAFLVAVAYFAVVVVAAVAGTQPWANAVFSISLGAILVATLAALFLRDPQHTFWRGFSLIAWIYMIIAFGPTDTRWRQYLVTDSLLKPLHHMVVPYQAIRYVEPGFELQKEGEGYYRTGPRSSFAIWGGSWEALQRSGHSVWAILLGLVGGYLAVIFNREAANPSRPT